MSSLYERIGGLAAVNASVELFYKKVLSDKRVSSFFNSVDMDKQIAKQKQFLNFAFGGAPNYSGKKLSDAHRHLVLNGLDDSHVDVIIELLAESLTELNVENDLIKEVAIIAESVRDQVLCRN